MDLSQFIEPVEGDKDSFQFNYGFDLQGKAIEELEDGDILIEGFAADFSGEDRENENFEEGAFPRAIKAFMSGASHPICFHHNREKVLGRVLELEEVQGKGVRAKARIDGAIRKTPELATLYEQIKNGTLANFSFGGFFRRGMTPDGKVRIKDMDLVELSITGTPTHRSPSFAVIAGKALEGPEDTPVPPIHAPEVWVDALNKFESYLDSKLPVG